MNQKVSNLNEKWQSIDANTKITDILELSGKDFKATVIKMFQGVIMNTLETNGKNRKCRLL